MRETDLISRWVKQLADLLAAVLSRKGEGKFDEAIQQIEAGCHSLFGIDPHLIQSLDAATIQTLLGDQARLRDLIRVLEEYASLQEARGDQAKARAIRSRAEQLAER